MRRRAGLARVSLEDGRLRVGWPPAADEMIPLAPDRFRLGNTDVEAVFVTTPGGDARLEVIGSAREIESTLGPRVYTWRAEAHPTSEQLEEYAGRYESAEVGTLELVVGNGTLMVRTRRAATCRSSRRLPTRSSMAACASTRSSGIRATR